MYSERSRDSSISPRRPLPGSSQVLRGEVTDANVLAREAHELFEAVCRALPPSYARLILNVAEAPSDAELEKQYGSAIEALVAQAEQLPSAAASHLPKRVLCPLCGTGPAATYENADGFLYPFGLWKHLTGHQRSYECAVLAAARRRAVASVDLMKDSPA